MVNALTIKFLFFGLILLAILFEVFGDILFKKFALENKNSFLVVGLVIYFIATFFWAISLKYEPLSKAISIFTVLNLIIIVLVGVLIFKENLSLINKIGIILGVISVVLVEL